MTTATKIFAEKDGFRLAECVGWLPSDRYVVLAPDGGHIAICETLEDGMEALDRVAAEKARKDATTWTVADAHASNPEAPMTAAQCLDAIFGDGTAERMEIESK